MDRSGAGAGLRGLESESSSSNWASKALTLLRGVSSLMGSTGIGELIAGEAG